MAAVEVSRLGCGFTGGVRAVGDVSFTLAAGEFFCLLGPSGCGKSTLLRLIGGYLRPDTGRVIVNGRDVTHEPPERRRTGMVFQNYALFPHLNALDNVAFGLRVKGTPKAAREAKANEMLDWVGLSLDERKRRPAQLSGGQQQRVALARALAFDPHLLMLDEPFANLDRLLRERLREELKSVQRRAAITTILVTHDREEAFALADRMAVMHQGSILQIGTPEELHAKPASVRVADFLGHANLFPIRAIENGQVILDGGIRLPLPASGARPGDHALIHAERIRIHAAPGTTHLPATVEKSRFAGSHRLLTLTLTDGTSLEARVVDGLHASPSAKSCVGIEIPPEAVSIIPSPAA